MFTDEDIKWIRFLEKLKIGGMSIREMREYVKLSGQGDSTLKERQRIVCDRRALLEEHIRELQLALDIISYKCWFYDRAVEFGSEQAVSDIPFEELPEDIQRIKTLCDMVS